MSDLAIIVPTKGRPKLARRLVHAIERTAHEDYELVFVVNASEAAVYDRVLAGRNCVMLLVPDDSTYPSKLNHAAEQFHRSYRYLALLNDDHEPQTPGWDVKLKNAIGDEAFGIAYGPDGIWEDGRIPSAPVITSSMYERLGWVALPGLHHILVDNVWWDLSEALGTRHFLPDVRIQHHHYTTGAAVKDETYIETSNQGHQDEDSVTYFAWRDGEGYLDAIAKLDP